MSPKSNVPVRIGGSRSRAGCRTCKQRHVKCDELRPVCLACQKTGRPCIYDQSMSQTPPKRQSPDPNTNPTTSETSQQRSLLDVSSLNRGVSPYGSHATEEVNAVKNFAGFLGKQLAGTFGDDVWCNILPQVAQHEPSIWHAVVAVSMLDSSIRLSQSDYQETVAANAATRQYGKAMQALNFRIESGESGYRKDVVLLSCALFAVFESMQNRLESALRHISGGLKLLIQWKGEARSNNQDDAGTYFDHVRLQPLFLCLDSQAVQLGAQAFRDHLSWPTMHDDFRTPMSFETVQEAQLTLNHIFNRISHWAEWTGHETGCGTRPSDDWMNAERDRIWIELTAWDFAFEGLFELSRHEPAALLVMTQRKVLQAFFGRCAGETSEMEWDKHLDSFKEALEYAEAYMKLTLRDNQAQTTRNEFEYGRFSVTKTPLIVAMDIVMPLFLISAKCRDSRTRRRALSLLKICNRKEGIWDSNACAMIAEKMIDFEESGALPDGQIPESARIFELDIHVDDERESKVIHMTLVEDEHQGHRVEACKQPLT